MRNLSLLTFCLVIFQISYCQEIKERPVKIGFKVGLALSTLTSAEASYNMFQVCPGGCFEPPPTYQYNINLWKSRRVGFAFGVIAEKNIGTRNFLIGELNYELKGIDLEYSESDAEFIQTGNGEYITANYRYINRNIRNNYLIFSGLFKRALGKKERFYLSGGLYGGYLLSSKASGRNTIVNYTFTSPDWTEPSSESRSDEYHNYADAREQTTPFDFGFTGGGGLQYPVTKLLSVSLEGRINAGFIQVGSQNNSSTSYMGLNSGARNLNLNLTACLFYKL